MPAGIGHHAQITRVRDSILTTAPVANNVIQAVQVAELATTGDAGARALVARSGGAIAVGQAAGKIGWFRGKQ
jgi:hypothetical protein